MSDSSILKKIYRALVWSSLVVLIVAMILILRQSSPPDVAYDSQAAARAQQKFAAADQAVAAGRPSRVQLDPTELNSYLHQNLDLMGEGSEPSASSAPSNELADTKPAPPADPTASIPGADHATMEEVQSSVRDVKVDMVGDLIKAYVVFNFHGKNLSLELQGRLHAEDGFLKFDPVSGKLGSLPLPQSTLDAAVKRLMESPQNREQLRLPPGVSDIRIENGQAVVVYK
jgi:hypothetical protein